MTQYWLSSAHRVCILVEGLASEGCKISNSYLYIDLFALYSIFMRALDVETFIRLLIWYIRLGYIFIMTWIYYKYIIRRLLAKSGLFVFLVYS